MKMSLIDFEGVFLYLVHAVAPYLISSLHCPIPSVFASNQNIFPFASWYFPWPHVLILDVFILLTHIALRPMHGQVHGGKPGHSTLAHHDWAALLKPHHQIGIFFPSWAFNSRFAGSSPPSPSWSPRVQSYSINLLLQPHWNWRTSTLLVGTTVHTRFCPGPNAGGLLPGFPFDCGHNGVLTCTRTG